MREYVESQCWVAMAERLAPWSRFEKRLAALFSCVMRASSGCFRCVVEKATVKNRFNLENPALGTIPLEGRSRQSRFDLISPQRDQAATLSTCSRPRKRSVGWTAAGLDVPIPCACTNLLHRSFSDSLSPLVNWRPTPTSYSPARFFRTR